MNADLMLRFVPFCSPFTASTSASTATEQRQDNELNRKGNYEGKHCSDKKNPVGMSGHLRRPQLGRPTAAPSSPSASTTICSSWSLLPILFRPAFLLLFFLPSAVEGRLLDTSVACDQHNFLLSLNFDMPFRGLVYSEEGFPNCVYVNGTMLSHVNYQLKIPLYGCETHTNADGNFENGIIIQDNGAFLQSTDKKYLLTCIPSSSESPAKAESDSVQRPSNEEMPKKTEPPPLEQIAAFGRENTVTVDLGGVSVDQSFSSTERNEDAAAALPHSLVQESENRLDAPAHDANSAPEFKYKVEIRSGHSANAPPIDAALNIGDKISYVVRLQKPISESQIGRCWASDPKSSLELSDEHGCSVQPRGNIWSQFDRTETDSELIFTNRIKAWAFPTSNEVNIFCNLRICMSQHCSFQTNCSAATAEEHSQKQKRSAGAEFAEVETLKTHIRIRPKRTTERAGENKAVNAPYAFGHQTMDDHLPNCWCISTAQLLLIGVCCCAISILSSVGVAFLLFTHYWTKKIRNGKEEPEDEIWSAIAELNKRNQRHPKREDCRHNPTHSRHAI